MEREEGEGREVDREGEGMKKRGRRRGGEMRGIIVGGITLFLLFGCNNGAIEELEKKNESILSISNLRQGFLDVFATFGVMVSDAFGIKADTTKKQVGEELGKVGEAVKTVKGKLEGIKSGENYNSIKDKADSIISKAIETLNKIVEGTGKIKDATKSANGKIANASRDGEDSVPADATSVKGLVEGISMICEAVKDAKVDSKGNADKQIADSKAIAKLFKGTGDVGGNGDGLKAANVALNAASGADILSAIAAAKDGTGKGAGAISAAKNAYDIAVATKDNVDANAAVREKGSVIAAGLALRAIAKNGQLATVATHAPQEGINSVLFRAASKAVNEIMLNIRKTVDKCLKDVSDCIKEDSGSEIKSQSNK